MLSIRPYYYEHDRQPVLLSYVPTGEYFQMVTGEYDTPSNTPVGFYRKICFQTEYGQFNCMNVHSGEVIQLRSDIDRPIRRERK